MSIVGLSRRLVYVSVFALVGVLIVSGLIFLRANGLRDQINAVVRINAVAGDLREGARAIAQFGADPATLRAFVVAAEELHQDVLALAEVTPPAKAAAAAAAHLQAVTQKMADVIREDGFRPGEPNLRVERLRVMVDDHGIALRGALEQTFEDVQQNLQRAIFTAAVLLLLVVAGCGLAVVMIAVALYRRIAGPLGDLNDNIADIRSGQRDRIDMSPRNDEIGVTVAAINDLLVERETQRIDVQRQKALIGMAGEVARFGGWRYEIEGERLTWSDEVAPILDEPVGFVPPLDDALRYFEGDDHARVATFLQRCLETGEPFDDVFRLRTAKGRLIWTRSVGHPFRASDGRILGAFGAFQDVTELQDMREREASHRRIAESAQKNESIGRLTGGVANDFNNLLAVIMGNLELLRDELDFEDHPDRAKMLQSALTACQRGADLTRNMLAFARRAPLSPQRLNLNDLVNATEQLAARTLPANVSIDCSLLANLWPVKADRASIESALLNLVVNASHALPEGGKITLETSNLRIDEDYVRDREEDIAPGRYAMVAVSDTGIGIKPEHMERIFEPFFTTKGPTGGSGLGLSMVQGFVKQSGGAVRVYSEVGTGTTFRLLFPALHDPAADHAPTSLSEPDYSPRGERLLLVEDEPDVLAAMKTTLERAGFTVVAVSSGDRAAALFETDQDFDLVVTDIVMPGELQGPQLVGKLRALKSDLPAVFLSGYASEATVHGNGLRPTDIRLMKPLQRSQLLAGIARALAEARST